MSFFVLWEEMREGIRARKGGSSRLGGRELMGKRRIFVLQGIRILGMSFCYPSPG